MNSSQAIHVAQQGDKSALRTARIVIIGAAVLEAILIGFALFPGQIR